jgi:glutathione synthase/RimK-type ligase-like ATP-grasp enzyme
VGISEISALKVPGPEAQGAPSFKSAHARYAQFAARELGYKFQSLDGDDGYLFEVRDGARRALFPAGASTPYALNDARAGGLARDKAFTNAALERAGLLSIPSQMFFVTERWAEMRGPGREPSDARAFAKTASYPFFCKPIAGSNGQYAERIENEAAFLDYMARVSREHFAVLVQPFLQGVEYRVFVLKGRGLFFYRKSAPELVGDGANNIAALAQKLARPNAPSLQNLCAADVEGVLRFSEYIPARGEILTLQGAANRALGGGASRPETNIPAQLESIGCASAAALDLELAGADLFDVSPARDFSDLRVIEVNSNPMIYTLEEYGRWDLILEIWRENFARALK